MLDFIRSLINPQNPILLLYHRVMAMVAALLCGLPARNLRVIAVTGTSGKTTTSTLIADMLKESGEKVGLASGSHFRIGDKEWINDTKQTTLGRFALHRIMKKMVKAGCKYLVLEVTSHALVQSRTWGIPIDVAVLTNLTYEHMEYQGGAAASRNAKFLLFNKVRNAIVLNQADENFAFFDTARSPRKLYFSLNKKETPGLYAEHIEYRANGTKFAMRFPDGGDVWINMKLPSESNVENALAAAAGAYAVGADKAAIRRALDNVQGMPGRYETIDEGQNFTVIVDYAHHPVSLERLCRFYKSITRGRLIAVGGGTGGGRDKGKRPTMGSIMDDYGDLIIITDDDPYTEDRIAIIESVASGVKNKTEGKDFWKIPDRKEAIGFAIKHLAREGDTVLIFGKGNEPVQAIASGKIPWDDREIVREFLRTH